MAGSKIETDMAPEGARIPVGHVIPMRIPEPVRIGIHIDLIGHIDSRGRCGLGLCKIEVVVVLVREGACCVLQLFCGFGIGDLLGPGAFLCGAPSDAFDAAYNNSQSNGAWHNEQQQPPPQQPQQPPQQNQLGPSSSVTYQGAVDAETLSLREEVARLRRMAEEDD